MRTEPLDEFAVVDASLAVKWLVAERFSDEVEDLLSTWESEGTRLAVPYFMPTEVSNVLHRYVVRGGLTVLEAMSLMDRILDMRIEKYDEAQIYTRAIELASQLEQGSVYDCHYLALAEFLDCDFWTDDRRFSRAAGRNGIDQVRWIGDFLP